MIKITKLYLKNSNKYSFCLQTFNVKTVLFQTIQFSISTPFSSILPIDRTLSGATTPSQSGPGSDGNKEVLLSPQSSSIIRNLTIRLFSVISRTFIVGGRSYPSAEKQSVYSTAPADWVSPFRNGVIVIENWIPNNYFPHQILLLQRTSGYTAIHATRIDVLCVMTHHSYTYIIPIPTLCVHLSRQ